MADNALNDGSQKNEPALVENKEDAETRAARRELKQSSLSDQVPGVKPPTAGDTTAPPTTPPAEAVKDDQILSPKKKRAHDQLDGDKEADDNDAKSTTSTDSAKGRASRLEPEKKRHRDGDSTENGTKPAEPEPPKSPQKEQPQTSSSAFAASGFGKLTTTSSPFSVLGGSGASAFGSAGAPSLTSFTSPQTSSNTKLAEAPKLTFGGGSGVSPFAGLSTGTNGFGSTLGGSSFGSLSTGVKPLGGFATPGSKPLGNEKPAKPFGAPDSDVESNEDDEEGDNESRQDEERDVSPEKESEEKKKHKLQKIEVNDGEAGEATILSVRAKVFYLDKEAGWKERGSGMLKINVPQSCVEFDDSGAPIPGSFDASGFELDEEEAGNGKGHKVARLILRQDQTHRVILNTAILPAMEFQEKASLKSVGILFAAFEGEEAKPVNITVRMTAANAKSFMNEIGLVQRELQNS